MSNRISDVNTYSEVIRKYKDILDNEIINMKNYIPKYRVSEKSVELEKEKIIRLIAQIYKDSKEKDSALEALRVKFAQLYLPECIIFLNCEEKTAFSKGCKIIKNNVSSLVNLIRDFENTVYKSEKRKRSALSSIYTNNEQHIFRLR